MPKCPHCGQELTTAETAAMLGAVGGKSTSDAKAEAARKNGAKGGRPPKKEQPKTKSPQQ